MGAVLLLCFLALLSLAIEVFNKLEHLKEANTDNAEWSFSQIEVDYYRMRSEFEIANYTKQSDLSAASKSFDVFYSRIVNVSSGPYASFLLADMETARSFNEIERFLDAKAHIIDAGDTAVRRGLQSFVDDVHALQPHVRRVSVFGLQAIVAKADHQREDIANTLLRLAIFTSATIAVLLVSSIFLFRFNQISQKSDAQTRIINKRMTTVLNASLDAIIVMDIKGIVVEMNPAAEMIFGFSRPEMIGHSMSDAIVPEKYRKAHNAGMDRFIKTGKARVSGSGRIKLTALNKQGKEFPIELVIDMLQEGDTTMFVAFVRDITLEVMSKEELVAARDRALAGERAKADFLAVMSHEMRTPLNGIIGTLALLEDTKLSDKQRESVNAMRASANLMQHHVNDVLDISRFDAGKSTVTEEVVDIDGLLHQIVNELGEQAQQNRNKITFKNIDGKTRSVITDRHKLRQILNNLIDNGNKFTRDGSISIEVEKIDETSENFMLEFRVFDTGIGIHHKDIDRIFNDFETIDSAYTRSVEGVGLGLGIVRRLVQALGGTIGVESTEDVGSLFWVRIPVTKSRLDWRGDTSSPNVDVEHIKPMKILMVEDNQINRYVLREMLTAAGHTVDEAENGEDGVKAANSKKYDVILMDISMPIKDGVTASTEIRAGTGRSSNSPIIATTAHALPHEIENFQKVGITDILKKPIEKSQLFWKLAKLQAGESHSAQEREHAMSNSNIDIDRINEMKEQLGEATLHTLFARFSAEADAIVQKMNSPEARSQDVLELVAEMHKVAGSSAALGVAGMQKQLNIMEHCGKTGELDRLWVEAEDLATLWGNCKSSLTHHGYL